jgi:hypothetical protein
MPSGWDVYYIVFLAAGLALGIPFVLTLISFVVSPGRKRPAIQPKPAGMLGRKINIRVFLGANAALVLIALILALVPCVPGSAVTDETVLARSLIAIVSVAVFAAMGLLYAARKGDLSWLKSYRPNASEAASAEEKES